LVIIGLIFKTRTFFDAGRHHMFYKSNSEEENIQMFSIIYTLLSNMSLISQFLVSGAFLRSFISANTCQEFLLSSIIIFSECNTCLFLTPRSGFECRSCVLHAHPLKLLVPCDLFSAYPFSYTVGASNRTDTSPTTLSL